MLRRILLYVLAVGAVAISVLLQFDLILGDARRYSFWSFVFAVVVLLIFNVLPFFERSDLHKKPVGNLEVVAYIVIVMATVATAFLYFRATFPH